MQKGKYKNYIYNKRCILNAIFILSIFVVLIYSNCLIDNTWAYFIHTTTATTPDIVTASYETDIVVKGEEGEITLSSGKYSLLQGKEYEITITAKGSATTGYSLIILNGEELHTEQFITTGDDKKTSITFSLYTGVNTDMQIIACWGTSIINEEEKIKNGNRYSYREIMSLNS